MSFFISAGAAIIGNTIGALGNNTNNRRTNDTNREIAQIPTRISGVDELINQLAETAQQQQSTALQENVNSTQNAVNNTSANERNFQNQRQSSESNETQKQLQDIQSQLQSQQQSINDSNIQSINNQVTETAGQTQGERDSVTSRGNAITNAALNSLTANLAGKPIDTSAQVSALVNQILRTEQAGINDFAANSGTFDSTTQALLQQDAAVKAAEAGVGLQLDEEARRNEQILAAISAGQAGTEATSELTTEEQKIVQALQGNQLTQQQDTNNTNVIQQESQNLEGTVNNLGFNNVSSSSSGGSDTNETSRQNVNSSQNTNASEQSQSSSTTDQLQAQTAISDEFQNPGNSNAPIQGSALGNLVGGGSIGLNQGQNPLVADTSFTPVSGHVVDEGPTGSTGGLLNPTVDPLNPAGSTFNPLDTAAVNPDGAGVFEGIGLGNLTSDQIQLMIALEGQQPAVAPTPTSAIPPLIGTIEDPLNQLTATTAQL